MSRVDGSAGAGGEIQQRLRLVERVKIGVLGLSDVARDDGSSLCHLGRIYSRQVGIRDRAGCHS